MNYETVPRDLKGQGKLVWDVELRISGKGKRPLVIKCLLKSSFLMEVNE